MKNKTIQAGNCTLHSQQPAVCSPLIGTRQTDLLKEADALLIKKPDVIEWRADFFQDIAAADIVLETAYHLKEKRGDTPLIFTIRSKKEGGNHSSISENEKISLFKKLSAEKLVDLIDYEVDNDPAAIKELQSICRNDNVKLILSHHQFSVTPSQQEMLDTLKKTESYGADIGKLAVMPENMEDVLSLLQLTRVADETLNIPIITMSMGPDGALTRLAGWKFGSLLTFAVGSGSSAPGQIPIEVVREIEQYLN
ncbi:type I 3-dehydroquinate dehydratase [Salibacterium aidingense]|uniref:type I 3-dehydroquinate dehydratase n=1 Tax=Salibacterium aidingense TaxID=384933 RepID=UPI003BC7FEA3